MTFYILAGSWLDDTEGQC